MFLKAIRYYWQNKKNIKIKIILKRMLVLENKNDNFAALNFLKNNSLKWQQKQQNQQK